MEEIRHQSNLVNEPWHSFDIEDVLGEMITTTEGISHAEAEKRLLFYGENRMPEGKKITIWSILANQLLNPLIFILIAAAIASIAVGEAKDALFIFIVIIINSALGGYQEYNAEKSASGLQKMLKIKARVIREGRESEIPSELVVPGDIVYLESGLKVPADIRLSETSNLEIDESFLTGESLAAKKKTGILREETGTSEKTNMAFAGSTVMSGRGKGVVVGTGIYTQVGLIAQNVSEGISAKPPLILRMEKFIKQITVFIVLLSVLIAIALHFKGMDLTTIFFLVVALAVSAIPEGMPVALTVALSIATRRMARRNVVVRRLTSVESLGSCTVIASDKTGTLTVNEQTAKRIITPYGAVYNISGEGYNGDGKITKDNDPEKITEPGQYPDLENIIKISALANEGSLIMENKEWSFHGDSMDIALLGMCYKAGLDPYRIREDNPLADRIPYESERQFSAAFCEKEGTSMIGVKGAVEVVLDFCRFLPAGEEIDDHKSHFILDQAEQMAAKGFRVLAFGSGKYPDFRKQEFYDKKDIPPLVFHGLVCFIDPLRTEARDSVAKCHTAGIKVIMITGDHPSTAGTIARDLGILDEGQSVVTGLMLSRAGSHDSPAYEKLVTSTTVFARVSPIQKNEIVDVLIRDGEFVAVTGDGVNDAPALRRANIGVAMGSGTDVAKEVGSMIIIDDNFSSIVSGVEEGRYAYDNVRKVIYLLISTGAAEIILFILSIIANLPLPLIAVQLLWLNLVTNGIQDVTLAFEGGEPGAMSRRPRKPKETIFNPQMIKQTIVSSTIMGIIVFGVWYWLNNFTSFPEHYARNMILLLMVFMQNFHVFNCRSETKSAFRVPIKRNRILVIGVLLAQGIHNLCMHIPAMQDILRIEPITFTQWLYILGLAIPMILLMEVFKYFNDKLQVNL